jgi:hypothetical protein
VTEIKVSRILIGLLVFTFAIIIMNNFVEQDRFETKRQILLNKLYENIEEATRDGRYRCCIKPACTMCYLGNWIWDNGSCYCNDMIINGEFNKVCPQCKEGIEGKCNKCIRINGNV